MFRLFNRCLFVACCLLATPLLHAYDNIQLKLTLTAPTTAQPFNPSGIAIDKIGRIWVTDPPSNSVVVFSSAGQFVQQLGKAGGSKGTVAGTGPGEFSEPHGIASDLEGLVYVADTGNNRIQVFSADGKSRLTFGEKGEGPGQFKNPDGLAVSQDGVVIVADRGNQRIQLFSKNGIFLHTLETGSDSEDVAVDVAGHIYVINAKTHQVDQWSTAGQLLHSFVGQEAGRKGFSKPMGVGVNSAGLIYVTDRGTSQIRELDPQGHTSGLFGRAGSGDGDFKSPAGVAVSGENVFVADPGNHRVNEFAMTRQEPLPPLNPVPAMKVQVSLKN
jgi:tripartite motif-containing protein 71